MKNHFFFAYSGNKREEVERLYNLIDLKNIKYIVEPFCGSCALSFYISLKHPKKFKYILNDFNKSLFDMFNLVKDKDKVEKVEKIINNWVLEINKIKDEKKRKSYYDNIFKLDNLESYIFVHKYYCVRAGLCLLRKDKEGNLKDYKKFYFKEYPIYNFIINEEIDFYNIDGMELYNKYKDNNQALIFMDPPYIKTDNSWYNRGGNKGNMNIYEYLYNNQITKQKAKIYLILENMWIIKLLFNNLIIDEFNKLYQPSKKFTSHFIISNIINNIINKNEIIL